VPRPSLAIYTETFSYDQFNRVSSRTWSRDGLSYTISYQNNTASQRTQITYPVSNRVLNISHDSFGRLSSLADQYRTYVGSLSYQAGGKVTGWTRGNGLVESFTYDQQRLQLTQQTATL
jgi:hypothetical protein